MNSAKLQLVTAALLLCLTQILPQSAIAEVAGTPEIAQSTQDREAEADRLSQQALEQYQTSQFQGSLQSYQQALSLYQEIGDRRREGATLNNIGLVYSSLGQYPQALEQYQQALLIRREVSDRNGEGVTLASIGLVYDSLRQYPQAIKQLQQALAISREVGNREGEGRTLSSIGGVYANLGQYPQALEQYQQALAISRELGDRAGEGRKLASIGAVYIRLRQYPQALEQSQQALAILREVSDRAGEGRTLNNIGNAYIKLGQYPQALEQYQQALVILREVGDRAGEGDTLGNLGFALLVSGDVEAATKTLFEAVEVLESLRSSELADADKVSLLDTQLGTYDSLQQALIAQNQSQTALEVAERGRARAFAELLTKRSSPQTVNQAASVPKPSIAQIKKIARDQNSTLVEYSIVRAPVKVEGREEWQPSKLYIWVVKPTGDIDFRSVDLTATVAPFTTLLNLTRQAIGARGRGAAPTLPPQIARQPEQTNLRLQQLYQVLIDPIADLLPANPNDPVIFIPQGELFLVPFSALQSASGKYLIQSHTILTSSSIQVLGLPQQSSQARSPDQSEVLIVGNPTMPSLPSLPPTHHGNYPPYLAPSKKRSPLPNSSAPNRC